MNSNFWFLILFAAVSLVSAFTVMGEGLMPVAFLLVAMIASTSAQALHAIHKRIDRIETKDEVDPE